MPCYSPLLAVRQRGFGPYRTENGNAPLKFINWTEENEWDPDIYEKVQVPCGKCIGCRLDTSKQWADRSMLELQMHDSAYFVTLTYDDVHAPTVPVVDDTTGEVIAYNLSLKREDVKNFVKRLRKRCGEKIRVFGCGEYGSNTFRPHYHLIIFGLHLDDLEVSGKSPIGLPYYTSAMIQNTWSIWHQPEKGQIRGWFEPIGFVSVGEVTWKSCAYVARYVQKKADRDMNAFYREMQVEREFTISPRRGGLGREYYELHKCELAEYAYFNVTTDDGGRKIAPPKYFLDLLKEDDPATYWNIRDRRQRMAAAREDILKSKTDMSDYERLRVAEENKRAQISALKRDLI